MRGGIVTITPMMTAITITAKSAQRALRAQMAVIAPVRGVDCGYRELTP